MLLWWLKLFKRFLNQRVLMIFQHKSILSTLWTLFLGFLSCCDDGVVRLEDSGTDVHVGLLRSLKVHLIRLWILLRLHLHMLRLHHRWETLVLWIHLRIHLRIELGPHVGRSVHWKVLLLLNWRTLGQSLWLWLIFLS